MRAKINVIVRDLEYGLLRYKDKRQVRLIRNAMENLQEAFMDGDGYGNVMSSSYWVCTCGYCHDISEKECGLCDASVKTTNKVVTYLEWL